MRRVALPITLSLLAGCASAGSPYPSLAPRPIEKLSLAEPEQTAPPAPPPADPALGKRYAAIVDQARKGDADFAKEAADARDAATKGAKAPVGSDAWIAAQQAATRVEAARGPVTKALADLDAERTSGQFDPAALDAATSELNAIDTRERAQLDAIEKAVTPG